MSCWRGDLFHRPETARSRPLIAASACLLGEPVRYDGGHRYQPGIATWLAPAVRLEAVCPEVGIGLGVPRPTLEGIESVHGTRIVTTEDQPVDVTDKLTAHADIYLRKIGSTWPLCACIFKARSPSCGVGSFQGQQDGAFAGGFSRHAGWLSLYQEENLVTEYQCRQLLLAVYICQDILWQNADIDGLIRHYGNLFGSIDATDNRLELWITIRRRLQHDQGKRRDLISRYRAI